MNRSNIKRSALILLNPIEVFIPYRQMRRRIYALLNPDTEGNMPTPTGDVEHGKGGDKVVAIEVEGEGKGKGEDKDKKNPITQWKKGLLENLSSVGIVAALVASIITSFLTGSAILSWPVRALLLSALLFALASIYIAVQQTMMLTGIVYNDPEHVARLLYSFYDPMSLMLEPWHELERLKSLEPHKPLKPHKLAVCFWNITVMLLTVSILLLVIGLNIWIFQAAVRGGDDKKIAVFFGVMAAFVVAIYSMCSVVRIALLGPRPPKEKRPAVLPNY